MKCPFKPNTKCYQKPPNCTKCTIFQQNQRHTLLSFIGKIECANCGHLNSKRQVFCSKCRWRLIHTYG